ncbi:acyl-CoA synthetase [Yunchengibacter salinarum]|uniref:acyl-CoA synthetase n=1 Tax=Yunchengibacter salinarum TaxID=3133399 RepID=UPI0035B68697
MTPTPDPVQALYDRIDPGGRDRFNFARDVLLPWAEAAPDDPAISFMNGDDATSYTISHLMDRARRLAGVLHAAGVGPGDPVMILLGRHPAWWETLTACLWLGAVACPGTTQLRERDLRYRLESLPPSALIADTALTGTVAAALRGLPTPHAMLSVGEAETGGSPAFTDIQTALAGADPAPAANTRASDPALCYFTSGTTGYPKRTLHGQAYGLAHLVTGRDWLGLAPGTRHWNISDTGWAKAAWSSYFAPLLMRAHLMVHPDGAFDAAHMLPLMVRHRVASLCAAPTVYRMLIQEDSAALAGHSLTSCVSAGEPLNPDVIARWHAATGITIRDGYGQTETALLAGTFPGMTPAPGSMGRPAPGVDLAIVDDAGTPLNAGAEGHIALRVKPDRPRGLFLEYQDDPDQTASRFHGDWYFTGDRGTRDRHGIFWFKSRADDVILSSGYRIGPFEVESALQEHPLVAESAVVSSPDAERGEVVTAYVVLTPGHEGSDALAAVLQAHVKAVTAPYKYPRRIRFVASLPKTVSGKIRRVDLRRREWNRNRH